MYRGCLFRESEDWKSKFMCIGKILMEVDYEENVKEICFSVEKPDIDGRMCNVFWWCLGIICG